MSFEPSFPGLFSQAQGARPIEQPRPVTEKQLRYAQSIAAKTGAVIPKGTDANRAKLSAWIEAHKPKAVTGRFSNYPSSKQVAFAERIARIKRRDIPRECFRDKGMMSNWIESNKPG
ncbi:hypothetical protein ROLI_030760 [Roseobacter fucihabitans]|uniref:Uncharacterized protein n=1 Tax=Roseobacter fucihabitans TaxID=1537242 RepID=A0ABZ2BWZ1_9RHOB|nr:hypothetical protein [Roseobacter litoralis]MBC6968016.1 hypothetical protein [Roseobacter litoralis]